MISIEEELKILSYRYSDDSEKWGAWTTIKEAELARRFCAIIIEKLHTVPRGLTQQQFVTHFDKDLEIVTATYKAILEKATKEDLIGINYRKKCDDPSFINVLVVCFKRTLKRDGLQRIYEGHYLKS